MIESVYIHIPFCERICHYCDFPKRVVKPEVMEQYLDYLEQEIAMYKPNRQMKTLFIGGGTPSLLTNKQMKKLFQILKRYFDIDATDEVTIEVNPEHVTKEAARLWYACGINRISLGVQTFNNKLLKYINRGHTASDVITAVQTLKSVGFTNISLDLIYSIPGQTVDVVKDDLKQAIALDVSHISAYSLILEEKTVFDYWYKSGKLTLVDEDTEAQMYSDIMRILKANGYNHYEISNYAKQGAHSRHNKVYWDVAKYYGFGMGASGYVDETRYSNVKNLNDYFKLLDEGQKPIADIETITKETQMTEYLILGLRLIEGINIDRFNQRFGVSFLEEYKDEVADLSARGMIEIKDHQLSLSKEGLFLGNEVFERFFN